MFLKTFTTTLFLNLVKEKKLEKWYVFQDKTYVDDSYDNGWVPRAWLSHLVCGVLTHGQMLICLKEDHS